MSDLFDLVELDQCDVAQKDVSKIALHWNKTYHAPVSTLATRPLGYSRLICIAVM
jgi:hypothetical protein